MDINIGRILQCSYGTYKVLARVTKPPECYHVEIVGGPQDGQTFFRNATWVTRDRLKADKLLKEQRSDR